MTMINTWHESLNYLFKEIQKICVFYDFATKKWFRWLKSFFVKDKDSFGNTRTQGINSDAIDQILMEYSGFSTRRVKKARGI